MAYALLLGLACQSAPAQLPVAEAPPLPDGLSHSPLEPAQKAEHVLARLSFGARPGEVQTLVRGGDAAIWAYIVAQLSPDSIDDHDVQDKLSVLPTALLSNAELLRDYPRLDEIAKQRGVDLGNEEQKRMLQNQIDPDHLARRIEEDLETQKLVRAVESKRQLAEVLEDFWFNHFNVDLDKGDEHWLVTTYERDVLRPHLFGSFRALLGAVAHSPAMLFYLDNWQSVRERAPDPRKPNQPARGLNENYARELMELHTVGVGGGYSQADVREAARCLTGWTIEKPHKVAEYVFRDKDHDYGQKVVLGQGFPQGGGEADGEHLLDLLASRPATAHFIAEKLARHFVADEPPPALVERLAQRFMDTRGDLREVYLTLFGSPEFWSRQAYRAKVKTPLEVATSAARALDAHLDNAQPLANEISRMGERLYHCQPPTGYADDGAAWVNSGALVARLNFGLKLAEGKVGGVHVHLLPFAPGRRRAVAAPFIELAAHEILGGEISPDTREVLLKELSQESRTMPDGEVRPLDIPKLAGLLLGSPEFQKR